MPNRTETNRANAELSTGPITPEGKQRSSQNALTHGLTARLACMPTEDQEEYQRHVASYAAEYSPAGETESQLVQALADAAWRLNRVVALEAQIFSGDGDAIAKTKALANLSLHSQRLSRQFQSAGAELRELQTTRLTTQRTAARDMIDIWEMYEDKGKPYDPSEDGFVLTEAQIGDAICARNRERMLKDVLDWAK
jgi:hypothetical protein